MIIITLAILLLFVAHIPYVFTECVDHSDAKTCDVVKRGGYCNKPMWGHKLWSEECKKSCGVCHAGGGGGSGGSGGGECVDKRDARTCSIVKRGGYCKEEGWRKECRKTCGDCGTQQACFDKARPKTCRIVKSGGYCTDEDWRNRCRKTCGACHGSGGGGGGGGGRVTDPPVITHAPPHGGLAERCIRYHNDYRRRHQGTPDVEYSNELAGSAQAWADKLVRGGSFHHSGTRGVGENLYGSDGYGGDHLKQALDSWYDEIHQCSDRCCEGYSGHYTQMVWKSTTKVGCGVAVQGRKVIVVAQYTPQGNWLGHYCDNVMSLK